MSAKETKIVWIAGAVLLLYFAYQANTNGTGPLASFGFLGGQAG